MTPTQWKWLESVVAQIPGLFQGIKAGSTTTHFVMGERVIKGRTVRLSLVAQVVDPGTNPLRSHASVDYPSTSPVERPEGMVEPTVRRRNAKRSRRWQP